MISIVVPNWNGASRLPACVRSLAALDDPGFEIVVVDNGSTDASPTVLEDLAAELAARERPVELRVLRNATNLGFAGGVNVGIRDALTRGSVAIALFNNDAVAEPEWLGHLRSVLDARPEVGAVTGRLLSADGSTVDSTGDFYSTWGVAFPRDRDAPATPVRASGPVFSASGGATLYRAELFERIGMFDEDFFAYLEDVDIGFRAQLAGYDLWYEAEAVAYHDQGSTSRTVPGFGMRQYFRNLPLLLVKNVPSRLLPGVAARFSLLYVLMLINRVRCGDGRDALRGAAAGGWLVARRGWRARRRVQRLRRRSVEEVAARLHPGPPPGVRILRGVRDRLRRTTRGEAA